MIKIVNITTDNREHDRNYNEVMPRFCGGHYSLIQGFALLPEIEVHVVSCTQQPMRSPEKLASNIWFHSLHVPKVGWLRTGFQGCIRAVRNKVRELQPDMVHGHGSERECAISAAFSGIPNLVTIHGNMAGQARQLRAPIGSYLWLVAKLENLAVRKTRGVLCNSTYTQANMRSIAKKTWLVPHALRLPFFDTSLPHNSRPCIMLNVGAISARKRQLELLDVAEALHRKGLKFEIHFVGYMSTSPSEANYVKRFLERIQPMQAAGYVRYLGRAPEADLVSIYDSASGVIHFPTEEAFGNVTIEALSRNLKFFGSRVGGIIDTTSGLPDAEVFGPTDWAGLTEAISRWIQLGHPRDTEAAATIRARYHPKFIAQKHLQIYRELVSSPL